MNYIILKDSIILNKISHYDYKKNKLLFYNILNNFFI